MKKILITLFALTIVNSPSFATLTTENSTTPEYVEGHGYSKETARLIDLQKAHINNTDVTYIEQPAWYTDKLPSWATEKRVSFVRRVFQYFDCGLDDGKFMQNNIDYTTRYDDL